MSESPSPIGHVKKFPPNPPLLSRSTFACRPSWLLLSLLSCACTADLASDAPSDSDPSSRAGGEAGDPGMVTEVEVRAVHTVSPQGELMITEQCYPLDGVAQHLSVSPEGQAWVALESEAGTSRLQVIDPTLDMAQAGLELELPEVQALNALSATDASFTTADGLWRVENESRVSVLSPEEVEIASSFCGDFSSRGALLVDGDLYQMRGEAWWQYSSPEGAPDVPTEIVRFDGTCTDTDEAYWMTGDAGTIWRVGLNSVYAPIQIPGALSTSGTAGFLGVRTDSQIWIGAVEAGVQTWQPWELPSGEQPNWLELQGGAAWMTAGSKLYRFDGIEWSVSSSEVSGSVFAAYATGIWSLNDGEACHYSRGTPIQLEGLRPFTQTRDEVLSFLLHTEVEPEVELNGEPVEVSTDEEGHYATLQLKEVGWSEVAVRSAELERRLWVKRIPMVERRWEEDVLPIYEANCADSSCHGSSEDQAPDLGDFGAWLERAYEIEKHVVDNETMPPSASRGPGWSEAQRQIISEWLEGGLLP